MMRIYRNIQMSNISTKEPEKWWTVSAKNAKKAILVYINNNDVLFWILDVIRIISHVFVSYAFFLTTNYKSTRVKDELLSLKQTLFVYLIIFLRRLWPPSLLSPTNPLVWVLMLFCMFNMFFCVLCYGVRKI